MESNFFSRLWASSILRIGLVGLGTLVIIAGGYLIFGAQANNNENAFQNIKKELALFFGFGNGKNSEVISLGGENNTASLNEYADANSSPSNTSSELTGDNLSKSRTKKSGSKSKSSRVYSETATDTINRSGEEKTPGTNLTTNSLNSIAPPQILISELMAGSKSSSTNEFIELYNPTDQRFDLSGLYIKRKATVGGVAGNLVSKTSGIFNSKSIEPHGFFLVGGKQYSGAQSADVFYSQNSIFLADNGDVVTLYDKNDNSIDVAIYGALGRGKSWERMALISGICVSPGGANELAGNGCDTGNINDFVLRDMPNPQNNGSALEPQGTFRN